MEIINNPEITRIVNRHVGKVLEAIDHLPVVLKHGVKSQLWLLHDDIQKVLSEELEKHGSTKTK